MSEHIHQTPEEPADREVIFPAKWAEAYLRRLGIIATDENGPQNSGE